MSDHVYHWLLILEFALGALTFSALLFIAAPYGRFLRPGWGPVWPARYAWLVMESPAVIVPSLFFFGAGAYRSGLLLLMFLLWQGHYVYRAFIYPFVKRGGEKPFPVVLVVLAILFNVMNGSVNGYGVFMRASYPAEWSADPRFLTGLLLFCAGFFLNQHSDRLLRLLRKPGEVGYKIPRGGMFRWVSNPHYLGEILEWGGWALLTWSAAGLAFMVYTFANLVPRALGHHRWYRSHFPDYPASRRAIFPFIW